MGLREVPERVLTRSPLRVGKRHGARQIPIELRDARQMPLRRLGLLFELIPKVPGRIDMWGTRIFGVLRSEEAKRQAR